MALPALTSVNAAHELSTIVCGECGGVYAIAERYHAQKQTYGGHWRCPYCACSWGYGKSEIDRVRGELNQKEQQLATERKRTEWARQEVRIIDRSRRAVKANLTRFKNRIGRGVCPCCRRNFENLQRHMKTKHPRYAGGGK